MKLSLPGEAVWLRKQIPWRMHAGFISACGYLVLALTQAGLVSAVAGPAAAVAAPLAAHANDDSEVTLTTSATGFMPPAPGHVRRIARWLPSTPRGVGEPIDNRAAWIAAARQPFFAAQARDAATFVTAAPPVLTEELFREVVTNGTRVNYEQLARLRTTRLVAFVIAECIEDQQRYLPAIETELRAICDEKTWSVPAVVLLYEPFGGAECSVDLSSANRAWTLATADYWLGDRLQADTRRRIRAEIRRRVLDGVAQAIRERKPHWGWMTADNNWSPVCYAGVVGAALTLLPDREERATFVACAENNLRHYFKAFPEDGFAEEGLSYWNYGFGSFLCLAETLYQQSAGRINWYKEDKLRWIALFPHRFEIVDGVFPAFGDAAVVRRRGLNAVAGNSLLRLISLRWNLHWPGTDDGYNDMFAIHALGDRLYGPGIFGFPFPEHNDGEACGNERGAPEMPGTELRTLFPTAGVVICRPDGAAGRDRLALALKGGRNSGGHAHRDAGTYVVVCNGEGLLVDLGMEAYTAQSFGPDRYRSMINNSYGHPVPYVGRTLQIGGPEAEARVIRTEFSPDLDLVTIDRTACYAGTSATRIRRSFCYDRTNAVIEITDEADFAEPTDFGTALITASNWREQGPGRFLVYNDRAAVEVTVTVLDGVLHSAVETVVGFGMPLVPDPKRIGVNLAGPTTRVVMRTRIVPAVPPSMQKGGAPFGQK